MIKGSLTSVIDTFGKNIFFSQKYVENGYTTGSRKVAKGHVPAIICTVKNVLFGHWFILARLLCFFFYRKVFFGFQVTLSECPKFWNTLRILFEVYFLSIALLEYALKNQCLENPKILLCVHSKRITKFLITPFLSHTLPFFLQTLLPLYHSLKS